jgi:hypothetical protein
MMPKRSVVNARVKVWCIRCIYKIMIMTHAINAEVPGIAHISAILTGILLGVLSIRQTPGRCNGVMITVDCIGQLGMRYGEY